MENSPSSQVATAIGEPQTAIAAGEGASTPSDGKNGQIENPLYDLYEKLYFHEIDVREKLGARLQVPLALIVSMVGALVYLVQNWNCPLSGVVSHAFLLLLVFGFSAIVFAAISFVRSWHGYTYAFLPTSEDSERYRQLLDETYKEYDNCRSLAERALTDYLCKYYIDCASKNSRCNDQRSLYLHKTNAWIIRSVLLIALAFGVFTIGKLGQQVKPVQVAIAQPVEIKESPSCPNPLPTPPRIRSLPELSDPPPNGLASSFSPEGVGALKKADPLPTVKESKKHPRKSAKGN
jgi:hypothetical protein